VSQIHCVVTTGELPPHNMASALRIPGLAGPGYLGAPVGMGLPGSGSDIGSLRVWEQNTLSQLCRRCRVRGPTLHFLCTPVGSPAPQQALWACFADWCPRLFEWLVLGR